MLFIVVPAYNAEKTIYDCLLSIIKQTEKNIYAVVVDDGSTDKTFSIASTFESERLTVIRKTNGGIASARNFALEYIFNNFKNEINNSFITFVDSDDMISSCFCEMYANILFANDADIVVGTTTNDAKNYKKYTFLECLSNKLALAYLLSNKIRSYCPTKLYKIELWKDIRFDETTKLLEDYQIMHLIFEKAKKIVFTNNALYYYRENPKSILRSKITSIKVLSMQKALICRDHFIKNNTGIIDDKELLAYQLFFTKSFYDISWHFPFRSKKEDENKRYIDNYYYFIHSHSFVRLRSIKYLVKNIFIKCIVRYLRKQK